MAIIDKDDAYASVNEKIKSARTYLQVKKDTLKLKKEQKNNLAQAKEKVTTTVEKLKQKKKSYQRQVKSQLDELLNIAQFNSGSGSGTLGYIKTKFIQAAINLQPKLLEILYKETISALGCSQQQTYDVQTLYIKVKSVDIQNLLKRDPNEEVAAVAYEKEPVNNSIFPYSMNRNLWERLQQIDTPVDFYSASGVLLFKISYTQTGPGGTTGDWFKVELQNPGTNLNKVSDFIVDYYRSIRVIDVNNIFSQLMDQLTGAVSFEAKVGTGELEVKSKFLLILQRILGLCFDGKKEIDVSGNAKVAELDGIDESFFEFTDIDLRNIDQKISNIKNGVVEFEDCNNVKLPLNSQAIMDELLKFNNITSVKDQETLADSLTQTLINDEKWKLIFPNDISLELKINSEFLAELPKSIMMALLSPKVLLPLMIMLKSLQQTAVDQIENLTDFSRYLKKYNINIMSKIGGLFVEELFNLIKRDIRRLISEIVNDVLKETASKKLAIILRLIEIILIVARLVDDWRKCKSVVDEILALLAIIGNPIRLPGFLVSASELLSGFSSARAGINIIEEFQKLGLPTGVMPDGSPNLMLVSMLGSVRGMQKEENENGKLQVFIKPLTSTPAGLTIPTGAIFGKKL